MTFGEKLRELRLAKGLTQKELADQAGTNQQSVGRWEAGLQTPAFDAVQALCRALGVKCMVFDDCDFGKSPGRRVRGRPTKEEKPKKKSK